MAEFCVDCWNELNGTDYAAYEFQKTWRRELCEGCGQYKRVIIEQTPEYFFYPPFVLIGLGVGISRCITDRIIDKYYLSLDRREKEKKKNNK